MLMGDSQEGALPWGLLKAPLRPHQGQVGHVIAGSEGRPPCRPTCGVSTVSCGMTAVFYGLL